MKDQTEIPGRIARRGGVHEGGPGREAVGEDASAVDGAESGLLRQFAIEQDADTVAMIFRRGYYDVDVDEPDVTDIYIRKNRNGPIGNIELRFNANQMSFENLSRRSAIPKLSPTGVI